MTGFFLGLLPTPGGPDGGPPPPPPGMEDKEVTMPSGGVLRVRQTN